MKKGKQLKVFYRINHFIQAKEVRVLDEEGKQVGVMPLDQALFEARRNNLDLVEIAEKANPPVCKIIDFKKFKYLEAKKNSGPKVKKSSLKEIRVNPFIAENDLTMRIEKARAFLKGKNQVKFSVFFRGRQIAKKEFGYRLLEKVTEALSDCSQVQQEPRLLGRQLIVALSPDEKKESKNQTKDPQINSKKI